MASKKESKAEKSSSIKKAAIYALVGGGIGAAIGVIGSFAGILVSTIEGIIALTVLGTSIGVIVGILVGLSDRDNEKEDFESESSEKNSRKTFRRFDNHARLQLREEQLEISKELTQLAEVTTHKEVVTEEKTFTVPVSREELVIEKRSLDNNRSNNDGEISEIMRIPLTEEQVNISKDTVKLEDVSIYTNQYEEVEHIEETLKKEKAHIETSGSAAVIDKDQK